MKKFLLTFILIISISNNVFAVGGIFLSDESQAHRRAIAELRRQRVQDEDARTQLEHQAEQERMRTNLLRAQAENNLLIQLGQLKINNQSTAETGNLLRQLISQLQLLIPAH